MSTEIHRPTSPYSIEKEKEAPAMRRIDTLLMLMAVIALIVAACGLAMVLPITMP